MPVPMSMSGLHHDRPCEHERSRPAQAAEAPVCRLGSQHADNDRSRGRNLMVSSEGDIAVGSDPTLIVRLLLETEKRFEIPIFSCYSCCCLCCGRERGYFIVRRASFSERNDECVCQFRFCLLEAAAVCMGWLTAFQKSSLASCERSAGDHIL